MSLKETYLSSNKKPGPADVHVIDVTPLRRGRMLNPLAPEEALSREWSRNEIPWKVYVERYYHQIKNSEEANHVLNWIIEHSATETIWLIGLETEYPGPRFLIIEVVDKVHHARGVIDAPRDYSDLYEQYKNLTLAQISRLKKNKALQH